MNQELFKSGIQTEKSDIRAHVSVVNKCVYVYETATGVQAMEDHKQHLPLVGATQPGVDGRITGRGYLMPLHLIPGMHRIRYESWLRWSEFNPVKRSTSKKGALAVECVKAVLALGKFPLWVKDAKDSDNMKLQVKGTDILIVAKHRIQVKCDWNCGDKPKGSGNLFFQIAEINPLKRY